MRLKLLTALLLGSMLLAYTTYNPQALIMGDGVTREQVLEIYRKISLNSGSQKNPMLIVSYDKGINAYFDGTKIVVFTGLMEAVRNEDELAMVIAHELAHAMQHHVWQGGFPDIGLDSREVEANADRMGAFLMMRAGFDICKGRKVFEVFRDKMGEDPTAPSHPIPSYRIHLLKMAWCRGE